MIVLQNTGIELREQAFYTKLLKDAVKLMELNVDFNLNNVLNAAVDIVKEQDECDKYFSLFFSNLFQKTKKAGLHDVYIKEDGRTEYTLLMLAIEKDLLELTLTLLKMGADVNQIMRDGKTALHVAASTHTSATDRIILELLSSGAHKTLNTFWNNGINGNTPLSCALGACALQQLNQDPIIHGLTAARQLLNAGANTEISNPRSLFDASLNFQLTLSNRRQKARTIKTWQSVLREKPYVQRGYVQAIANLVEKTYFDSLAHQKKADLFLHHNIELFEKIKDHEASKAREILFGSKPDRSNATDVEFFDHLKEAIRHRLYYYHQSNAAAQIEIYLDALLKFYELKAFLAQEGISVKFNHFKVLILQYIPMGEQALDFARAEAAAPETQNSFLCAESFSFGSIDPWLNIDHLMQLPLWRGKAQGFSKVVVRSNTDRHPREGGDPVASNPYHPDNVAALEGELLKLKFQQIDTWLRDCGIVIVKRAAGLAQQGTGLAQRGAGLPQLAVALAQLAVALAQRSAGLAQGNDKLRSTPLQGLALPQSPALPQGLALPQSPALPPGLVLYLAKRAAGPEQASTGLTEGNAKSTANPQQRLALPQSPALPQGLALPQNPGLPQGLALPQSPGLPQSPLLPQNPALPQSPAIPQGLALYLADPWYSLKDSRHAPYIDNGIKDDKSISIESMTQHFDQMKAMLNRINKALQLKPDSEGSQRRP